MLIQTFSFDTFDSLILILLCQLNPLKSLVSVSPTFIIHKPWKAPFIILLILSYFCSHCELLFHLKFLNILSSFWRLCSDFPRYTLFNISTGSYSNTFPSIQFSRSVVSGSLQPHESQHTRPPCPSPTPGVYSHTLKHLLASSLYVGVLSFVNSLLSVSLVVQLIKNLLYCHIILWLLKTMVFQRWVASEQDLNQEDWGFAPTWVQLYSRHHIHT